MARAHLYRPLTDNQGNLILNASVSVLQPGTNTAIAETIYEDSSSGTVLAQPLTPTNGVLSFYLDEPRFVRLQISRPAEDDFFVEDLVVDAPPAEVTAPPVYVEETVTFAQEGAVVLVSGSFRWYVPVNCTIVSVRASVGTAPTGSVLTTDLNVNGTSVYSSTQANRPMIAIGANTALGGAPDTVNLTAGQYLTVDVDTIGSTTPGSNLIVQVRLRHLTA